MAFWRIFTRVTKDHRLGESWSPTPRADRTPETQRGFVEGFLLARVKNARSFRRPRQGWRVMNGGELLRVRRRRRHPGPTVRCRRLASTMAGSPTGGTRAGLAATLAGREAYVVRLRRVRAENADPDAARRCRIRGRHRRAASVDPGRHHSHDGRIPRTPSQALSGVDLYVSTACTAMTGPTVTDLRRCRTCR